MITLSEINYNSVQTVLDLIADDNLYRATSSECFKTIENKHLEGFELDNYAWISSCVLPDAITHILNSAIGQLLKDITD